MKTLLFYTFLFISLGFAHAQSMNEYTLEIKNITVNDCGKEIKKDTLISKKIYLDQDNTILLYENESYRYYTFVRMQRSSNRIQITEKNFITDKNNSIVKSGKQKKQVQFINVSMPGKFENTSGEYLLIDKNNFTSIQTTFLRTVYYGHNQPN